MEKFKSFLKKYWITIWMILSVLAVITVYVSAEYIQDQNRVKRVIANMGDTGKRFSSDRLFPTDTISPNDVPFPTTGDDLCPVTFQIYNHSLTDSSKRYQDEIYYQISAKLTNSTGGTLTIYDEYPETETPAFPLSTFGVRAVSENSYSYFTSINDTLTLNGHFTAGEENDDHLFYVCFPRTMTTASTENKVYVELTAIPYSDSNHTQRIMELDILKARLSVTAQAASIDRGWTGSFQDSSRTDLDGLTFVFSGSGSSKLVLSYKIDMFEVNKFFLEDHSTAATITDAEQNVVANPKYDPKFTYETGCYYVNETTGTGENAVTTWKKYTNSDWNTIIIDANSEDVETNGVVTSKGVSRYDIQLYMKNENTSYYLNNAGTGLDWDKINNYIHSNPNAPSTAVTGNAG